MKIETRKSSDGQGQPVETLVYDVVEAGRLLGLGRTSSYEAVRRGDIPTIKIGGRYKVPKRALEQLLASAGQGAKSTR